jgi:hypothetical protein
VPEQIEQALTVRGAAERRIARSLLKSAVSVSAQPILTSLPGHTAGRYGSRKVGELLRMSLTSRRSHKEAIHTSSRTTSMGADHHKGPPMWQPRTVRIVVREELGFLARFEVDG